MPIAYAPRQSSSSNSLPGFAAAGLSGKPAAQHSTSQASARVQTGAHAGPMNSPAISAFLESVGHFRNNCETTARMFAQSNHKGDETMPHSQAQASGSPSPLNSEKKPPSDAITKVKEYFESIQWKKSEPPRADISCNTGTNNNSKIPAIKFESTIAVSPDKVFDVLVSEIENYQNWLPIIKKMEVIDSPSDYERILSIDTHGKFGVGGRFSLAMATFQQGPEGETWVVMDKLDDADLRYKNFQNRQEPLKLFKTFMEFKPSAEDQDTTHLTYFNHTDPDIPRVPKWLIMPEAIKNHAHFVEECAAKLVNSAKSAP